MKKMTIVPLASILLFCTLGSAHAAVNGCDDKRAEITAQIENAKKHNNAGEIAGLEQALSEVNTHCTHEGLVRNAEQKVRKHEAKVVDKQGDITEVKSEIEQAKELGRADKVAKLQKKLAKKEADLVERQDELKESKEILARLKG